MKIIIVLMVFTGLTVAEIWLLRRKSYFLATIIAAILLLLGLSAIPLAD